MKKQHYLPSLTMEKTKANNMFKLRVTKKCVKTPFEAPKVFLHYVDSES